jgi:hypothetical protein
MSDISNGDKPLIVPAGKNPFETLAEQSSNQLWFGELLKFQKGDWVTGPNNEECTESELVAIMPGLMTGWIRWEDHFPVEHKMGLVQEGFVPPALETLSHRDKDLWEVDDNGKPQDPWQDSRYLPMISVNGERIYTFATSTDGGRRLGIAPLSGEYGARIKEHPYDLPVVGLSLDSYQHSNRSYGRIKYPVFPIKRYVKADVYLAAVAALTGKTLKLLPPM